MILPRRTRVITLGYPRQSGRCRKAAPLGTIDSLDSFPGVWQRPAGNIGRAECSFYQAFRTIKSGSLGHKVISNTAAFAVPDWTFAPQDGSDFPSIVKL